MTPRAQNGGSANGPAERHPHPRPGPAGPTTDRHAGAGNAYRHLILIGASTGGTRALTQILEALPQIRAAVLIVQHMPAYINASLAHSLGRSWRGELRIARDGDDMKDGLLLLAPSEVHCRLVGNRRIRLEAGPKVNYVCPSIDVTMKSVHGPLDVPVTGVLLTGMGTDGAEGLLHLRRLGAVTIAQDEDTCAVYGMPRRAMELGAADYQRNPAQIAETLSRLTGSKTEAPEPVCQHRLA